VAGTFGGIQSVWACIRTLQETAQPGNAEEAVVGMMFCDETGRKRTMRNDESANNEKRLLVIEDMVRGILWCLDTYRSQKAEWVGLTCGVANVEWSKVNISRLEKTNRGHGESHFFSDSNE